MVREPVHLSDWIQYLISIKNLSLSLGGVFLTIVVALIIALVGYENIMPIEMQIVTIIVIWFFIFLSFWLTFAKNSPLNKSIRFINRIMKYENEMEVNEIRIEWYDRNDNMLKHIKNYTHLIILGCGLVFMISGVLLMTLTLDISDLTLKTGFFSAGVGALSIGIALWAIVIAFKSDEKMQSLANYHLLEIKGIIEDRRLNLQKHRKILSLLSANGEDYRREFDLYHTDFSHSFWKTLENLRQVQTVIRYSTPNYQLQVIDYVHKLFQIFQLGRDENRIQLREEDKSHMQQSFNLLARHPAFNQYTQRDRLSELVRNLTD